MRVTDQLADRTGLGEAITGSLLLGIGTSLPGITASVTAAVDGYPTLAVANAVGGIAVQSAFLAVADAFHPRVNLEHAAASATNLIFATVLVGLLALVLLGMLGPGWTIGHVDLTTPLLGVAYLYGLRLAFVGHRRPMWRPRQTPDTRVEAEKADASADSLVRLLAGFAGLAVVVAAGGITVARAGAGLVEEAGLSESLVGGLLTGVSTSAPELATTIAAVRRGALTLAVSDIVGGNAFDVLFIAVADVAFLSGSVYTAAQSSALFLTALALLLNVVILLGLILRQPSGPAGVGFESVVVLVLYVVGMGVLIAGG